MQDLSSARALVNDWMREHGASFSVIRQGSRQTADAPFDPIPRILSAADFTMLERGLIQRVSAMNLFLSDIYGHRMILRDGVIPEEFVFSSPDFRPECMNLRPVKDIYTHITATDLIHTADGKWYVMEDSLVYPAGITYPHFSRKLLRERFPEDYRVSGLCDNCGLDILLRQLYRDVMEGNSALEDGIVVLLRCSADPEMDFEIRYMAQLTGAVAALPDELIVMDNKVYYRSPIGGFRRVAILHRALWDRDLDPMCFDETYGGIPHLMEVYSAGNIAILNAPGCALGEDRGLLPFVPDMIRYYLDEEPLLLGVPSYLPWYEDQRAYILSHMDQMFFKDVASNRRTAAIRGSSLTPEQRTRLAAEIEADPRRFLAQEVLRSEQEPVFSAGNSLHRCDLRLYTVHSDSIRVWMGGLSRFVVHGEDSADAGFKDTWVMAE